MHYQSPGFSVEAEQSRSNHLELQKGSAGIGRKKGGKRFSVTMAWAIVMMINLPAFVLVASSPNAIAVVSTSSVLAFEEGWSKDMGDRGICDLWTGDLKLNGETVIIANKWGGGVFCYRLNGEQIWANTTFPTWYSSSEVADIDHNGRNEIIIHSSDGNTYCLNDEGGLIWKCSLGVSGINRAHLGDTNGDGYLEILVGSWGGRLILIDHLGQKIVNYNCYGTISARGIIDIDSDSNMELIGSDTGKTFVLSSNGSLKFSISAYCSTIEDIDHNGYLELICQGNVYDHHGVYLRGLPLPAGSSLAITQRYESNGGVRDLDNDGRFEYILLTNNNRYVKIFDDSFNLKLTQDLGAQGYLCEIADLNSDECLDLILANLQGDVLVLNAKTNETWKTHIQDPNGREPYIFSLVVNETGLRRVLFSSGTHSGGHFAGVGKIQLFNNRCLPAESYTLARPLLDLRGSTLEVQAGATLSLPFQITDGNGTAINGAVLRVQDRTNGNAISAVSSTLGGLISGIAMIEIQVPSTQAGTRLTIELIEVDQDGNRPTFFPDGAIFSFAISPRVGTSSCAFNSNAGASVLLGGSVEASEKIELVSDGSTVFQVSDSYALKAAAGVDLSLIDSPISSLMELDIGLDAWKGFSQGEKTTFTDSSAPEELRRLILVRSLLLGIYELSPGWGSFALPAIWTIADEISAMSSSRDHEYSTYLESELKGEMSIGALFKTKGGSAQKEKIDLSLFNGGQSFSGRLEFGAVESVNGHHMEFAEISVEKQIGASVLCFGGDVGETFVMRIEREYEHKGDMVPLSMALELTIPESRFKVLSEAASGRLNFFGLLRGQTDTIPSNDMVKVRFDVPVGAYLDRFASDAPELRDALVSEALDSSFMDIISRCYSQLADYSIGYEISHLAKSNIGIDIGGKICGIGASIKLEMENDFEYVTSSGRIIMGPVPLAIPEVDYAYSPLPYPVLKWISDNYSIQQLVLDAITEVALSFNIFRFDCPVNVTINTASGSMGWDGVGFSDQIGSGMVVAGESELYFVPKGEFLNATVQAFADGVYGIEYVEYRDGSLFWYRLGNITCRAGSSTAISISEVSSTLQMQMPDNTTIGTVRLNLMRDDVNSSFSASRIEVWSAGNASLEVLDWPLNGSEGAVQLDISSNGTNCTYDLQRGQDGLPISFPAAIFTVDTRSIKADQLVWFNATMCSDARDQADQLVTRWDWEGDGIWDTEWSGTKLVSHKYASAGTYMPRMEVMNSRSFANATVDVGGISVAPQDTPWVLYLVVGALAAIVIAGVILIAGRKRKR